LWETLTTISVTEDWQYTEPTKASYIKIKSLGELTYGKGYLAQSWNPNGNEPQLFDIQPIYAAPEPTIVKLDSVTFQGFGEKKMAIRRDRRQTFDWSVEIEHIPDSKSDVILSQNVVTKITTNLVNSSVTPILIFPYSPDSKGISIKNNSTKILYLKFGQYTKLPDGTYPAQPLLIAESDIEIKVSSEWVFLAKYEGIIKGFWTGINGSARVKDFV
jgi:hypothetical protein